jgi:hypothetical protein
MIQYGDQGTSQPVEGLGPATGIKRNKKKRYHWQRERDSEPTTEARDDYIRACVYYYVLCAVPVALRVGLPVAPKLPQRHWQYRWQAVANHSIFNLL